MTFYQIIAICFCAGFATAAIVVHILRGRVRRKKAEKEIEKQQKEIAEQKEREELFQCIDPIIFNSAQYIESPIDLNSPDLNFNN